MTLKYRWSLITSFVCSACVAVLWSLNLGAVYPFVEIVLKNDSLHGWADAQKLEATNEINVHQGDIVALEKEMLVVGGRPAKQIQNEIATHEYDIEAQEKRLAFSNKWVFPMIQNFAPKDPFVTLVYLMAIMFFMTLMRGGFLIGSMISVARVGQRTMLDLQNNVFRNVLDMETSELDVKGTGDLISRIRGETGAIGQAIMTLFGKTVREPLKMIVCLSGAAWVNPRLLLLSLLVCPLAGYLMAKLAKVTKRANKRAMEDSAKLLNRLYQSLSFMRVVRAFNMEDCERKRFEVVANDVYRKSMRISVFSALSRINTEILGVSMMTLSVLVGGYLVLNNETHLLGIRMCSRPMGFGQLMLFFAFLIGITDPLRKMGDVYNMMQAGIVAADRVYPLIDQHPAVADPVNPLPLPAGQLAVEFDDVRFEYEAGKPILNGINESIAAGTSLAIVGHNGCGKSTLTNLIPRFFDTCSSDEDKPAGRIKVSGIDVRHLKVKDLRGDVGYVSQMTMLFSDTIAENISYGTQHATREEVIEAAKKAHAHEFIVALEEGYDSNIGEHGGKLSGGQRQRLSLARAILKNPRILILDEATSQIDPESKQLIHETLAEFIKGRTTIIITHRFSTLELVDRIMMMQDGLVVDCGTHEQLLSRCVEYQRMQNLSMENAA